MSSKPNTKCPNGKVWKNFAELAVRQSLYLRLILRPKVFRFTSWKNLSMVPALRELPFSEIRDPLMY